MNRHGRGKMESLTREEIRIGLAKVNDWLAENKARGEVCLYGGACLCLAFSARNSTKDVDAVFEPASLVRKAAFHVSPSGRGRDVSSC